MTGLSTGWHHLDGSCHDIFPAATFLDVAGSEVGRLSTEKMVRPYFRGRPDPTEMATRANVWHNAGCRVVLANEPNLPSELFNGGPADYASWFARVAALTVKDVRLYYAGMSPGVDGWRDWLTHPAARQAVRRNAAGLCVHAYGTLEQMRDVVSFYLDTFPDTPLFLSEVNFGAGQRVDRDAWARDHFRPFLDWCADRPAIEGVTYFAFVWPTPDVVLPTPVDGAGTGIEGVLREWQPNVTQPKPDEEPTMPQTLRFVDISNYQGLVDMSGWTAAGIDGVVVRLGQDGGQPDPFAPGNWRQAGQRELLRAGYFLSDPAIASPADSLDLLGRCVAAVGGLVGGDGLCHDAELGPDGDLARWTAEWGAGFLQKFGFKSLFYSGPWWMGPHGLEIAGVAEQYSGLWEADYTGNPDTRPSAVPGWDELVMVQYTANGNVPGVNGPVDLNTFLGGRGDWLALGKPGVVEPPRPAFVPRNVPPNVLADLDDLWNYVGPDTGKQKAIIAIKEALGLQQPAA